VVVVVVVALQQIEQVGLAVKFQPR